MDNPESGDVGDKTFRVTDAVSAKTLGAMMKKRK